ncbi:unnamed protein product [Mytilus edulis]|uniref:Uncharacterized protein n=1 Tax=Mytilus edulis TaxID=6550 RepID=A0A8S3R785_MYTED|nr:unnamed protein product [Mytilus edulis]
MSDDEDITFRTGTNHQSDKVIAWAEVMKLNTATANEMLELGFDSMEAVALIEKEDLDNSSIPIGQRKLLLRAVGKTFKKDFSPSERMAANSRLPAVSNSGACALQDGDDGSTVNKDGGAHEHLKDGGIQTNTDDAYVNAVLQQLTGQQTQYVHSSGLLDGRQNQNIEGNSMKDPQIYLKHSNIDSKVNYLDIIDFVGNDIGGTSMPEERLISNASGGQLVFKSGPLRPKLESLSLCQWSRANLSIMYKLLSTGELAQTQILDYLSYTMRFYQLVSSCEFVSVLFFDREYRRLQKQHTFRWGTDIPHLQSVYLRPKAVYNKSQASGPIFKNANKQQQDYSKLWCPTPSLCPSKKRIKVKPVRDLVYNVWHDELKNDVDKDFLLQGIKNGFDIVQDNLASSHISAKNHPSANPSSPLYNKAHQQILTEIENGNYEFAKSTPKIISPLGIIPKSDGGVRIIHDCSRPLGSAVNDFAGDVEKQKFQSVDDAAKLVTKNCFMAKVDLKSAYRSVSISSHSQQVTGLRWTFPDGVEIDSTTLELRLPIKKLDELRRELASFQQRKHVSKKQLQSLAGKLNWASSVVHGGRVFLRRIIDSIMQLKHDRHKMRLSGDILHDIHWWYNFMATFNGKSILLNTNPVTSVYTDACNTGAGGFFGTDWFYVNWKEDFPFAQTLHINEQEALAVALAVKRWAKCWQNRRVFIYCDNASTVACINKCTSRNKLLMSFLRELFWLSAANNFHLVAIHLPGSKMF